jgi:hypothetical protein
MSKNREPFSLDQIPLLVTLFPSRHHHHHNIIIIIIIIFFIRRKEKILVDAAIRAVAANLRSIPLTLRTLMDESSGLQYALVDA